MIYKYPFPNPIPPEWRADIEKMQAHETYGKYSKGRGFTGDAAYRYKGLLNHKLSEYFIKKLHEDSGITIETDTTWTRGDKYDLLVNGKHAVQIKSTADRFGNFNKNWTCQVPADHWDKYKTDPQFHSVIFGCSNFKTKYFHILGYITKQQFDAEKQMVKVGDHLRGGYVKKQGGNNWYVYPDQLRDIFEYLNEMKKEVN